LINDDGRAAFFIPIDVLHAETVEDYLAMDGAQFEEWLASDSTGWFFLDAVDELKLTPGKVDIALGKVARALKAAQHRAHIILTCRPTDWRPGDLDSLARRLPISEEQAEAFETDDEAFLQGIRQDGQRARKEKPTTEVPKLRVVSLQPLNDEQIKQFAATKGIKDPEALLLEIRRREAWTFARRPLDLEGLIRSWIKHHRIGTKLEQHESDVETSLRDGDERNATWLIAPDRAREGAERLALALALTRTRTVRVPGDSSADPTDTSMVDPEAVLSDWTPADRAALLRLPIFDVATYGRVRFHHRSVAEYLAARRLAHLKAGGLSKRGLMRLMFAERYSERIVIPSMRPIAAWLALTDGEVREELLRREPEILVSFGDAEALPQDARAHLVRRYAEAYSSGSWRGLNLSINDIQRLAQPDLADTIRALWSQPISNEEVVLFLLKLIWLAPIGECADLAFEAAMNADFDTYPRVLGLRALAECKRTDLLRKLADDMRDHPDRWPPKIIHTTPPELYPHVISTAELLHILATVPPGKDEVSGFSWSLHNLVDTLEPGSEGAVSLRRGLADLIWENRADNSTWYQPVSKYSFLAPAVTKLCVGELKRSKKPDPSVVRDTVIAHRFHGDRVLAREEKATLASYFAPGSEAREIAILAEMEVAQGLNSEKESGALIFNVLHRGLIQSLEASDWNWLIEQLKNAPDEQSAKLFYDALMSCRRGRDSWADEMRSALTRWPELAELLEKQLAPRTPDPDIERMNAEHEAYVAKGKKEQERIANSWLGFRRELEERPDVLFGPERLDNTRWHLIVWVRGRHDSSTRTTLGGWRDVRNMLGDVVGKSFEQSCRDYWRSEPPEVWSEKKEDERNRSSGRPHIALTGLSIESSVPGWAENLTLDEVERAAGWATTELNGHPEWINELATVHPEAVGRALAKEVELELRLAATLAHPATLSAISRDSLEVKRSVASLLRCWLVDFKLSAEPENAGLLAQTLDRVRGILLDVYGEDADIASAMKARFLESPASPLGLTWLRGVVANDFSQGMDAVREALNAAAPENRRELGLLLIANLFGDRRLSGGSVRLPKDAAALKELAILAFDCIRREDDVVHEGVYSPDLRDDAEDARNRILNSLVNLSGPEAYEALKMLAAEPLFSHMPDRLRALARERAACDSEAATPMTAREFREWETRYERAPKNLDELYDVVADRLDDMEFDLVDHDFGYRDQLQRLTDELEVQPHIARYFREHARGQYTVTREPEVAERKRRDVELAATAFVGKATIELKIGDKWTLAQLKATLSDQIIARYLKHPECRVGFLVVTFAEHKKKKFGRQAFEEVIAELKEHAAELERQHQGRIRLGVVGLDLRPPEVTS
jgi:hypothetical protein